MHTAMLQAKGLDTAAAAVRVSGLELGGLAGSLSAGKCSAGFTRSMGHLAGCDHEQQARKGAGGAPCSMLSAKSLHSSEYCRA